MRLLRTFAGAILLLLLPIGSRAENVRWFEVRSGNFLLLTDTSEAKGRRLVTDLEQRVATFQAAFGTVPKRQFPIEIFLFNHNEEFLSSAPVVAPPAAAVDTYTSAYFVTGPDRMFIVAQDKSPDDIVSSVGHALGHVFFDRMVLWHPFWLEEGAAEYFRKIDRNPDGKRISSEDRIPPADLLKTVPSSTFNDSEPAGPFRIQAYRLLRLVLDDPTIDFPAYMNTLKSLTGRDATLHIDIDTSSDRLNQFNDTRILANAATPYIEVREIAADRVAIQRGDELLAARQTVQAEGWYEGDAEEARAARAILGKFLNGSAAEPLLQRAARDFPDRGLVQYYFGSLQTSDSTVWSLQVEALQRAVQLLPMMGRADAELARVLTLAGKAADALPYLDRAIALEPEFADGFTLQRAESLLALRRLDEAHQAAETAALLPHGDRSSAARFDQQRAAIDKRIQDVTSAAEQLQVEQLRASVEAEATRREPPKPPPPPRPPDRFGKIDYTYEATNPVEILEPVFPDYPQALVTNGKAGSITLQVNIGTDGKVTGATMTNSQLPEMNAAALAAAKQWRFKPLLLSGRAASFSIKLTFQFGIQQ
jgi:TonB family protein